MKQLRAEQRAFRLAERRRRLGITQAQVAARMGITQGRVHSVSSMSFACSRPCASQNLGPVAAWAVAGPACCQERVLVHGAA